MTFVSSSIQQKLSHPIGGLKRVDGSATFTTTGTTGTVDCLMSTILGYNVQYTSAPGAAYRSITQRLGAVTATTSFPILTPPYAGTLIAAKLTVDTTHATHADNHWTFTLVNKGAAGSGTTDMILATAVNSTDADSTPAGSAITAFVPRSLSLHGTAANLVTVASDVLSFVATKAASAVSLSGAVLDLTFGFGDPGEIVKLQDAFSAGVLTKPSSGVLTFVRNGVNPSSAATIAFSYWGY